MFSRMPVPVWDSDMVFLDEPLDTTTVVSDDIWKKFDLDVPLDNYHHRYQNDLLDTSAGTTVSSLPVHCEMPMMMHFDKLNCQASRKIRHHDCMWAGLCISKEHNRTHPAKKDTQLHRRIPAGRSLLIPKNTQHQYQSQHSHYSHQATNLQQHSLTTTTTTMGNQGYQTTCRSGSTMAAASAASTTSKNLESDGDSTRPETPQSSESETESDEEEDEEEEEEEEAPVFRHEQININDIVSVSEVTGQQIPRRPALYDRRKEDERMAMEKAAAAAAASKETVIRNTLMSDHCYHLNQQPISSKKLEHLGVQTPSDSEEEIDVVSYEKPTRPASSIAAASLPTFPSPAEQQHFQLTVNTAFKDRHHSSNSSMTSSTPVPQTTAPRPRGRPPTVSRKRANQVAAVSSTTTTETTKPAAKRARHHRPYQRRASPQKHAKSSSSSSPQSSPAKLVHSSRSSSDDEPDTEKRSLHNNMERQRRIELRNAFEDLRVLVPEVEAKEKAPKVAILRQAASYCDRLTDAEQLNLAKVMELKRKQERLRAQLSQLRRSFAMQR